MPGNDAGDRIHNFFGQDNSVQGQPRSQVADRNWPALTNNPWAGSQRQIVSPLFSNLKNHNVQQTADMESGHGGQPSSMQHGMNFSQSNLRADFPRNHSQGQQPTVNGYMHGHQFFHVRQNEANFLGVGAESDRQNLSSQGFSVNSALDSQQGNGPELHRKNSVRMDLTESPVNYDFFGNQQMSGQHASMMQTLQRQQSGVADMQMLQQQLMLNQIQEMQRQQQYQKQQQASQLNGMNQVSSFAKQAAGNQSMAMINGIPIHDASNFAWQPELMAANANWSQRGTASFMPGSSGGLMLSPDQGQVLLMGMTPQQVDQSLRGVPISGSRVSSSQFSPIQVDKPTAQQISGPSNSFQGNQYTGFSEQISMHDSRQGYQGKNMIGTTVDGQGINSGFDLESMHPVTSQPSNTSSQEFNSRRDTVFPPDKSQDKSMTQGAPSQSVATLDPTEEKILFGSDDNLWDAFGKGNMGSMGCSVSDGADVGTFSSLQSGSWSALMQSAVAETSGSNVASQEEWSGLTFQNNGYSATNQQSQTTSVSGKSQPTWVHNSLQNPSPDTAVSYNNVPVSKQSLETTLLEQNDSSQRFPSHFPGEAAERLDSSLPQKLVAERSHIFGKPYSSSDAGSNSKSISSHWTNQQSMPTYSSGGQPGNRPNGFNFLDAVSTGMNPVKNQQNEQSLQGSLSINKKGPMFEAAGSGPDVWKSDNLSNSAVNLERENSVITSPEFKVVDSNVNAVSASPSSNTARASQVSSQQIPNSNNIDIWKPVDSSRIPQGSDVASNLQYVTDKRQQNVDLSGDNTLANGTTETLETQNFKTKTSTIDGFYNIAQNAAAVGVKENSWLDTSDSQTIPGGKSKSSGNIARKPPARKFQYHPMGDVDVEPPYASKNVTHSQSTLHQIYQGSKGQDQGYTFPNQIDRSSMGSEKDPFSGFQEEPKGLRASVLPGSAASSSTPIERAVNNHSPNRITPSSQNMLELFHKVDQSREHGNTTQYSSLAYNQPEPRNPDGSVQLQRSQPSGSQGFSLQLGPPSQILPVQDHAFSSQGNLQKSNSTNSSHVASGVGEKGHNWFASTSSAQSLPPSRETSQGELRNDVAESSGRIGNNAQVNFDAELSSNFPFPRRHFPNQHMNETGRQPTASPSGYTSFDSFNSQPKRINESCRRAETSHSALASVRDISGKAPHDNIALSTEMHHPGLDNQKHTGDTAQHFPVLEATQVSQQYTLPSMSQGCDSSTKSPPVWTSVPPRQNSFGAQQLKSPSNFLKSSHHSDKTSETTPFQPSKLEDQSAQKGGTVQSESGQFSENSQGLTGRDQPANGEPCQQVLQEKNPAQTTMSGLQGKEHFTSSSLSNSSSSQRDMEAFGRSLQPNDTIHQNYSLLNQMQGMKKAELDPGNRSLKRFRSPDGAVDAQLIASQGGQQLYGQNKVVGESLANQVSALPGDLRNVNLTAESADDQDTNASPQDMVAFGQNDSEGSNLASVRGEHSRISPQMAPSWFDRYGTFKNGQILPTYDPRKAAIMKAMEMASTSGRLPDATHGHSAAEQRAAATADAPQHGIVQTSLNAASLASENPSSQLLRPEAANTTLVVVPAKKRKSASSELIPWHREVMHGPKKLQNISTAEVDWARASNRLPEKVGFEAVMIEDGQPVLRSRRRVILTTQLLQLLLSPPSFSVLSAEAILHHQSVIQCIARATLGDACSALSVGDAIVPSNGGNLISEKLKTTERISDQFFSKVMEDLINRAKKLEDDVLRLDKRASILDLRVECQDLEKFSAINRFARFHGPGSGRGQPEAAEASSSDASTNAARVYPQRYVTALPMPRYLPDNVQCLSL